MNIPAYWSDAINTFEANLTPFGYYDTDTQYQQDVLRFCKMAAGELGWPTLTVELTKGSLFACFEQAINIYAKELYNFQIIDNYGGLYGSTVNTQNMSNTLVTPSLGGYIRLAKQYGSEAGTGGSITYHTGRLDMVANQQLYDLKEWAEDNVTATNKEIEIKRIFHNRVPASVRAYGNLYATGMNDFDGFNTFGFAGYSNNMNYLMVPLNYDLLKMQSIEFNDQIRRSSYGFELKNNVLRIMPVPRVDMPLFFEYIIVSDRDESSIQTLPEGTITNQSNVPYGPITYNTINFPSRAWIFEYGCVLAYERLSNIRTKYGQNPTPDEDITLNGDKLGNDAQMKKDSLITALRDMLTQTSQTSQLEKQAAKGDQLRSVMANIPTLIYVG